jgi:CMP-N-acetylneuraminic acid synthetase
MHVLGLIPARGGSKGVPRKNIRLLCGKPVLLYTAEAALSAKRLDRVVLSTDDEEIAEIGKRCGIEVPFIRPSMLAKDDTPMLPVVQHALRWMESNLSPVDVVCLLQPTNPLRRSDDIDRSIDIMEKTGCDSVISFVDVGEKHPARMKYIAEDGRVVDPPFAEETEGKRRQDLPKIYLREGSIYLTRRDVIMTQNSFKGGDCRAIIIPQERACNIDTPMDLLLAELLLKNGLVE